MTTPLRFFWIKSARSQTSNGAPAIQEVPHLQALSLLAKNKTHRVISLDKEGLIAYNIKTLSWDLIEALREEVGADV